MKIKILCTLGPTSLRPRVIEELDRRGVALFRINLSHASVEDFAQAVAMVQRYSSVPICLDTQGAQVRCGPVAPNVFLKKGHTIQLTSTPVMGTAMEITLWPSSVIDGLGPGAWVAIDSGGATVRVERVLTPNTVEAAVVRGGRVRSNRAVVVDPSPRLPPLTDVDLEAIDVARDLAIEKYALSFASSGDDVEFMRSKLPSGAELISKIESRDGVRNMDGIIGVSDAVLIDRGDLSREIPVEYVPYYQKAIARRANRWRVPVYVATNLLESMVAGRRPTVAEANDIANTLIDGVHGLVLAAETAVGLNPVASVDMVVRAIEAFDRTEAGGILHEAFDQQVVNIKRG